MEELTEKIRKFAEERDWLQFNTPENLAKSISIEAGELLECFQWNNNYNVDEVKYEIADVMNYCILLCSQIGVDPKQIILEKIEISMKKYPIDKCKGKSVKYDKLWFLIGDEMEYQIRECNRNDSYAIAHIVTISWNETYKGIVPDDFLNELKKNEQMCGSMFTALYKFL